MARARSVGRWALGALALATSPGAARSRRFAFPTYASAVDHMRRLAEDYPQFVTATTAQREFGLPSVGTCPSVTHRGARHDGGPPCENWILHITNHRTLPDPDRPDILILGGLHGDERIGQVTTLELAALLASSTHPWMRRLVDATNIWLVPMTNAVGYARGTRLEMGLFPNRDFGYVQLPAKCMTTVAGRTVNELFARRVFRIVVTFHGGMTSIGYPWGSFNHHRTGTSRAPDDAALHDIAAAMSSYASTGMVDHTYPFGTMNDQVYPVHGGLEDWAYAASFDPAGRVACRPGSYGGYPAHRSAVGNATARALVFLVEAGPKRPREQTLGGSDDVLTPGGKGDGHVPRNIRLALTAIDFLQPHVELLSPPARKAAATLHGAHAVSVGAAVSVRWRVWGAQRVDAVHIVYRAAGNATWVMMPLAYAAAAVPAATVWGGPKLRAGGGPLAPHAGVGSACIVPRAPGAFEVAVRVVVDSHWGRNRGSHVAPAQTPPQSHLARARTDAGWRMTQGNSRVYGRMFWDSEPFALNAKSDAAADPAMGASAAGGAVEAAVGPSLLGVTGLVGRPVHGAGVGAAGATGSSGRGGVRRGEGSTVHAFDATALCADAAAIGENRHTQRRARRRAR